MKELKRTQRTQADMDKILICPNGFRAHTISITIFSHITCCIQIIAFDRFHDVSRFQLFCSMNIYYRYKKIYVWNALYFF